MFHHYVVALFWMVAVDCLGWQCFFQDRYILQHVFALAVHKGMMIRYGFVVPCP